MMSQCAASPTPSFPHPPVVAAPQPSPYKAVAPATSPSTGSDAKVSEGGNPSRPRRGPQPLRQATVRRQPLPHKAVALATASDPYAPGMCGALRSEYSTVSGISSFSSSTGHGPSFLKLR